MVDLPPDEVGFIDAALQEWRQGDVVLGRLFFVHLADLRRPMTRASKEAAEEAAGSDGKPGLQGIASEVEGLVILTQTCDVIRCCRDRPFIEVAPLVSVAADAIEDIRRARRPAYAYVPAVAGRRLVADLDRAMTVEKAVISEWERVPGWTSDAEARLFAEALARKRVRFAFPDDFVQATQRLQRRIKDKHGKGSDEGRLLAALREVRVRAAPCWGAKQIDLSFWFLKDDDPENVHTQWHDQVKKWLDLIDWSQRFVRADFTVCRLDDMTAQDYVESERLDLDYLSIAGYSPEGRQP